MAELRLTDPDELVFFVRDEETGESAPPGIELVVESVADAAATLRRVRLGNASGRTRRLTLTSYAGIVLHDAAAHAAHPGFSKLFVQTRLDPAGDVLLARRRPRGPEPAPPELAHALLGPGAVSFETDRARFLGRGRTLARPAAQEPGAALTGTLGNVLDPIASWRRAVALAPGETAAWIAVLALGASGEEAAANARSAAERAAPSPGVPLAAPAPAEHAARFRPSDLAHDAAAAPAEALQFDNGSGGFSADGRAYVIHVPCGADGPRLPPLPWVNVIASADFGTLVSERGAANTWSRNSREHRLTPWSNDPIGDPHGEALWIRDEAAGVYWSPQPGPTPARADYVVRHGFGESSWTHESHGLAQEVVTLVAADAPLKLTRLSLENRSPDARSLSLFSYAQLVLGVLPEDAHEIHVEAADERTLLATNRLAGPFADGVAFASLASDTPDAEPSQSGDRAAFLGPGGSPERPRALAHDAALDGRTGAPAEPCFAQQLRVRLAPGERIACTFLLGEATSRAEALALVSRFSLPGAFDAARDAARDGWERTLGAIRVETPSPALDVLVNGWLAYQTLSCRIHGRTAFYQSGGAFGFRDQLQDAASLVALRPDLTRRQILLHAAHQFAPGDVLHWWHPPHDRGTRTRFSDDLLWLPSLTAHYVAVTGDAAVLDEPVGFVTARALEPGEDEAYLATEPTSESASVYEHCCRAIERSLGVGAHGLPLMGTGDWNDGMNRVGREGRGESVWMGFFLFDLLRRFEPLCRARGDAARAERYAGHRAALAEAIETHAWDGAWYRRAWFDDGTPLGTAAADECRIDVLPQAWATLSRAARPERCETALDSALRELVLPEGGLIRLLTPPFDRMRQEPGYIKGYVPGIRENGGQYTHAACWLVRAAAERGRRAQALALLEMILPVNHARTPAEVATYQVEPYVVAADVYAVPPHVGRGGWTWYTGSSGWMLRVALESVLGLTLEDGARLVLRPCVPDEWSAYRMDYRALGGDTRYAITVTNPGRCSARVVRVTLDGAALAPVAGTAVVPLARDGRPHTLEVELGP